MTSDFDLKGYQTPRQVLNTRNMIRVLNNSSVKLSLVDAHSSFHN